MNEESPFREPKMEERGDDVPPLLEAAVVVLAIAAMICAVLVWLI